MAAPLADEKHRAPLLWLLAPYLGGLVAGRVWPLPVDARIVLAGALLPASAAWLCLRAPTFTRRVVWAGCFVAAGFAAGFGQMRHALRELPRWHHLPPREAELTIQITRVYAQHPDFARQSCLAQVQSAAAPVDDLIGQRLFVSVPLDGPVNELVRSQVLRVHGVLTPLRAADLEPGSFDAYLASLAIPFRLDRARVVVEAKPPASIERWWRQLGRRFETVLRRGVPPALEGTRAYLAMFLGRRSELSENQRENFLRSGTMHLFAISGLHIAMIALCLHSLLLLLRVPRKAAAVAGLLALWVFVEATGGTPSARRAFLMVGFIWAGTALRRPANPLASLVTSAWVVLVLDPLALLGISFQLSYAVVGTVVLYGSSLRNRWLARWHPFRDLPEADWHWWHRHFFNTGRKLITLTAVSIAATLISTPLSLAHFGLASPGAIFTNLAAIPLATGVIAAGFISLLSGLLMLSPLSIVFNHAAVLILTVIDMGVSWAAAVPGVSWQGGFSETWMAPVLVLMLVGMVVTGYGIGWHRFPGGLWSPPVLLLAGLVLLVTPGPPGQESTAMKSAYELAMERLKSSDDTPAVELTAEQKAKLAEIDRVYQGKIAEREIFLQQRLVETQSTGDHDESEKVRQQLKSERARLEEEREEEKNRVRREAGKA